MISWKERKILTIKAPNQMQGLFFFSLEQLGMLMVTMYVADGLKASLMSVEMFVEPSHQVLMRRLYVCHCFVYCK
jgi:hypothetical protein